MKLAIVILNWNGKALLKRFLPSVVNYSEEANIYVIDNNSSDDSIDYIQSNFPSVKLIRHDKNYGFSEGYNLGLKDVEEDLLCLLNNDVEVTPNWLSQIIKCFNETDASIGQPMMLQANQKTILIMQELQGVLSILLDTHTVRVGYSIILRKTKTNTTVKKLFFGHQELVFLSENQPGLSWVVLILLFLCIKRKSILLESI
jgi:glycosyltransferase involved in cell wall biosynthesis